VIRKVRRLEAVFRRHDGTRLASWMSFCASTQLAHRRDRRDAGSATRPHALGGALRPAGDKNVALPCCSALNVTCYGVEDVSVPCTRSGAKSRPRTAPASWAPDIRDLNGESAAWRRHRDARAIRCRRDRRLGWQRLVRWTPELKPFSLGRACSGVVVVAINARRAHVSLQSG